MASVVESEFDRHSDSRLGRLPKLTRVVLLPCVGILCALVFIEIGFRAVMWLSPAQRWNDRPHFYYNPPAATTLQDYPYPEKKADNTFRIAVAGDSFTFGPRMQFDDTFPKRLERILSMNDGPLKAEVINYGVAGYSTEDEVAVAKHAVQEGADLVLLEITLNDPELQMFRAKGGNGSRFGPLKINKKDTPILYYWKSLGFVAQRLHAEKTRTAYRQYFFDLFENPQTWNTFQSSIEEIARLREHHSVKVAAVLFPLISFGFDDSYPFFSLHKKIAALAESLNLPFLDLFESYRNIPSERLQVIPVKDPHPNEIAHRIAAEEIYTWLIDRQLIPDSLQVKRAFWARENKQMFSKLDCKKRPEACFGAASSKTAATPAQ